MTDINDDQTPMPEAPKGAAIPPLDPKVNPSSQPNGNVGQYLDDKGSVMSAEGLLNRFKELSEADDPINAILITELQEVKDIAIRITQLGTIGVLLLGCVCAYVVYTSAVVNKKGVEES